MSGAPGGTGNNDPWYQPLDEGARGRLTTLGLHQGDPVQAVGGLVKALVDAETKLGMPASEVMRVPKSADDPAWAAVHERMGVPKEASAYDFSSVKKPDGSAPDQAFLDRMRKTAFDLKLPAAAAVQMAQGELSHAAQTTADEAVRQAAAASAADTDLRRQWGGEYEINMFRARNAGAALGMSPEIMDAIGRSVGVTKFMEELRVLGAKLGEPGFHRGESGSGSPGAMTRDQAVDRKAALMQDRDWGARFAKGETAALAEMTNLNRIIVGPAPTR